MSPADMACPKCGAAAGERCRSLETRRTTDTHKARWDAVDWAVHRARLRDTQPQEETP